MSDREILSAQFPSSEVEQIEEYRERKGYNKSEALKELVRSGLQSEADSGHQIVKPLIKLAFSACIFGLLAAMVSATAIIGQEATEIVGISLSTTSEQVYSAIVWFGIVTGCILSLVAIIALATLEVVMDPSEAPIRRYLTRSEEPEVPA